MSAARAGSQVVRMAMKVGMGTAVFAASWNAAKTGSPAMSGSSKARSLATTWRPTFARIFAARALPRKRAKSRASGRVAPVGVSIAASTVRNGRNGNGAPTSLGSGTTR